MSEGKQGHVIRTDAIQGDILHEYDGIEEADNQLPIWWLTLFFGAIVFGVAYWFAFHEYGMGELPGEQYAEAKKAIEEREAKKARALAAKAGDKGVAALADDPATVQAGAGVFAGTCVACHGANAAGNIGPNLTDNFWIHGGTAEDIQKVISEGVAAKGMPAWGPTLGPLAVQQVTAYVLTLRGTNVAGKEPQGEPYEP